MRTVRERRAQDGHLDFHTAPKLCAKLAHTGDCFEAARNLYLGLRSEQLPLWLVRVTKHLIAVARTK